MAVELPTLLIIGFTGHRQLPDESRARTWITAFLREQQGKSSRVVCGLSSLAAGGDLLFAEACIQLGIPLRVLLPMPVEQFREDFDEPSWARVVHAMEAAIAVEVTGNNSSREARYYECGIRTSQQCDVLLALWDGESSRGLGGTGQIVSFAKAQGRAIYWLHSTTGAIQEPNRGLPDRDPELDYLNALPEAEKVPETHTPLMLAEAWFRKVDASASVASPQVRRLTAIPILGTAAAALLSAIGPLSVYKPVWVVTGSALGLAALVLPEVMNLNSRHVTWARLRTAAEIARSNLALWKTPGRYSVVAPEIIPELSGMIASLNYLKSKDTPRSDLEQFKHAYREGRIQDQIRYFSGHARRSHARATQTRTAVIAAVIVAQIVSAGIVLGEVGFQPYEAWKDWLTLSATILFQVATVAGAVLVVNDYRRRRHRYRELESRLREWDTLIAQAQTWPVALQIVESVERALLAELIEWRSLIRHNKLPHNA